MLLTQSLGSLHLSSGSYPTSNYFLRIACSQESAFHILLRSLLVVTCLTKSSKLGVSCAELVKNKRSDTYLTMRLCERVFEFATALFFNYTNSITSKEGLGFRV